LRQDFCSYSRRANRRIASYVTVCAKLPLLLTLLTYIPVGNAEEGQKDKSVAGVIKFTFLSTYILVGNAGAA
jgi:uncharacterized protein